MISKDWRRLQTSLRVTLIVSIGVLLAGAIVRATGSGMGCPDWPLCYGCWIPPFSVHQLPADYAAHYAVDGHPAVFNAVKTWIEYFNRLVGVSSGICLLVTTALTWITARRKPSLLVLNVVTLIVLGSVAWLGARVVGTFLGPYEVTLHLLGAYLLYVLLLVQLEIVKRQAGAFRAPLSRGEVSVLVVVGLAFFLQWALGIRTREEFEAAIWNQDLVSNILDSWGGAYTLHRISAVLVVIASSLWVVVAYRAKELRPRGCRYALAALALVGVQACIGLVLWWGQLPEWAKPLHLLVATIAGVVWAAYVAESWPSKRRSRV